MIPTVLRSLAAFVAFACCATLQASTITSVSAFIYWSQFPNSYQLDCAHDNPAASHCAVSDPGGAFADIGSTATATIYELSASASGGASGYSGATTQATAQFDDHFVFTPDSGQPLPETIQFDVWSRFDFIRNSAAHATFNGTELPWDGTPQKFTIPYATEFEVIGAVSAGFSVDGYSGEAGQAFADLMLTGVTALDANGAVVSGVLVDPDPVTVPEPPTFTLTAVLLALFCYRAGVVQKRVGRGAY